MRLFIKKIFANKNQKQYLKASKVAISLINERIEQIKSKRDIQLSYILVPNELKLIEDKLTHFIFNRLKDWGDFNDTDELALSNVLSIIINNSTTAFDSEEYYCFGAITTEGQALRIILQATIDVLLSMDKTKEEEINQLKMDMKPILGAL